MSIDYKEQLGNMIGHNSKLQEKVAELEKENLKLTVLFASLKDEFLDMGGDPKQLELFENQQLEIFEGDSKPLDEMEQQLKNS